MIAFLVPTDTKGLKIPLDRAIVFIGRHPECDIILTRSRKVSRKHCTIAQVNNSFVIRDLGSMNGVRLNGQPVKRDARLKVGDEVSIGDLNYVLTVEKPAEPEQRSGRGHSDDAREAGRFLEQLIKTGDVILVKGSQSMRMERVVEEIMAHPEQKEELLVRQEEEWLKR